MRAARAGAKHAALRIALFEPEIAGNVGAILRLGACLGASVDLIEPLGFLWDDRRVRRAAMDYIDHVSITRHAGFDAFRETVGQQRLVLLTTKSAQSVYDFRFRGDDILLFGKESAGAPDYVHAAADARLVVPLRPDARSLNLSVTAGIALWEGLRQTGGVG